MTCSDCEVNKNIYSFGTCECGNMYSEKLPHPGPRRYESYKESIVDHSDILLDERYAEAWEYKDNPYNISKVVSKISRPTKGRLLCYSIFGGNFG